jgi:hypothetical protein
VLGIRWSVWAIAAVAVAAACWSQPLLWGSGRETLVTTNAALARPSDARERAASSRAGLRRSAPGSVLSPAPRPAPSTPAAVASQAAAAAERVLPPDARAKLDPDPELIRDLRILEEEAARLANGAPWLARAGATGSAADAAAPTAPSPEAAEDPQRRRLSDAALEEHLVRRSYAGIVFPAGYPAERVARQQARRRIEALSAPARRALLSEAVETLRGPEQGPELHSPETGRVWAGGPG